MSLFFFKTFGYIAIFMVSCATARAQTLLHNLNGDTATAQGLQAFSAMLIGDDGRIVAVGDADLLSEQNPTAVIDVGGRIVLPGLIDAHAHVAGLGFAKSALDPVGMRRLSAAVQRIGDCAERNPNLRRIQGRGWNPVRWPVRKLPTTADIDAVVNDRDYFAVPVDDIDDIRVLQTWIGGKQVFDATAEEAQQ